VDVCIARREGTDGRGKKQSRSELPMTRDKLHEMLRTGTMTDLKNVLFLHFHRISHTESFAILISRLEIQEEKINEQNEKIALLCYEKGSKDNLLQS